MFRLSRARARKGQLLAANLFPTTLPMLYKRIIPCLDVNRGRVVKGVHFLQLRDAGDPVEVARRYEADGADELVFLDISATHEGRDILLDTVRRVSEELFMPFTVGGGIRSLEDATRLIQAWAGADAALAAGIFRYNEYTIPATKRYLAGRGVPIRL